MAAPIWKQCALGAYYWASLPARRRASKQRAANKTQPVSILFYHRVADRYPNDWTMPTAMFAAQIAWLRKRFEIVSLAEAQTRIDSGSNEHPTVCITFDDGYADNMLFAVPLLLKHKIPFNYFVSTDHVIGGEVFPHDAKAGQPLAPNKVEDLRQLVDAGVDIGAHTKTHADLGADLPMSRLVDEIANCKRELELLLGTHVGYFAFPYGQHKNMTTEAFRVAYEAGYLGVCSAYGGYNLPGDDSFHLRRIHADPEMNRFKNWLTIDARKMRRQRDYAPGAYRQPANQVARVFA